MVEQNFINEYVEYCVTQTDAPPIFHKFLGYVILSSIINNKVSIPFGFKVIHPNLFLLIVAPSSSHRKSWSMSIAANLISHVYPDFSFPDPSSREAFISEISDETRAAPHCGLIQIDELKGFMAKANHKSSMDGFLQDLASVYDGTKINRRKGIDEPKRYVIDKPFVNIMAACSNDWLYKSVESGDITGGFLARFIWIVHEKKNAHPLAFPPLANKDLEMKLVERLNRIKDLIAVVDMTPCNKLYEEWHGTFYAQHQGGMWDANYHRGALIIQKVAALNAVVRLEAFYEGSLAEITTLEVNSQDMQKAILMIEDSFLNFEKITIGVNRFDTLCKKVLKYVVEQGQTSRSYVLNNVRGLNSKILDEIVKTLEQANAIEILRENRSSYYKPTDSSEDYLQN